MAVNKPSPVGVSPVQTSTRLSREGASCTQHSHAMMVRDLSCDFKFQQATQVPSEMDSRIAIIRCLLTNNAYFLMAYFRRSQV